MLLFASLTAVILAIFSVNIYYSAAYIRRNAFADRLWERMDVITNFLTENYDGNMFDLDPIRQSTYRSVLPDEEIILIDHSGDYGYINEFPGLQISYTKIVADLEIHSQIETMVGLRKMVGRAMTVDEKTVYVIVSSFDKNGRRLLYNLRLTILWSYFASIFLIFFAGWYFSRKTFEPIQRVIETAGRISETDLHLRVPVPKGKNELVHLVHTINESFDRLESAFDVQRVFVANASHELRTPLTALRGELELALFKERTAEEYKQFVNLAYESSKQLSKLVTQLLLFAQAQGDKRGMHFQLFRVDELLMDVMQQQMTRNPERNIEFRFTEGVPDESRLMVLGNESLLQVAFSNILENALKFSEDDPVAIDITTDPALQVCVSDKGIGISLTDIELVFQPFYRSKRSSDTEGIGLGLALTKQIVQLHGGSVWIESKLNEGTMVFVTL
jgi:signal transduction histidine kinase